MVNPDLRVCINSALAQDVGLVLCYRVQILQLALWDILFELKTIAVLELAILRVRLPRDFKHRVFVKRQD